MSDRPQTATLENVTPEIIEEWFLEAAEGALDAVPKLTGVLEACEPGILAEKSPPAWNEGLEIFLDSLSADSAREKPVAALLLAMARAGLDTPLLRDLLAHIARETFRRFLDPSAMLKALGVHDPTTPTPEIAARWTLLEKIAPGRFCLHPAHGFGKITALDLLSGTLTVDFGRPRPLSLSIALSDLWLIPETSPLFPVLDRNTPIADDEAREWTLDRLLTAGFPVERISTEMLRRSLVPSVFSEKQFATLLGGPAPESESPPPEENNSTVRPVAAARNLQECLESLRRVPPQWRPDPDDWEVVRQHLEAAKSRPDQVERFAETLARILQAAGDEVSRAAEAIDGVADAYSWESAKRFTAVSIALPGRHVPSWFRASFMAKGADWFAEAALALPLRLLRRAWETAAAAGEQENFLQHVRARLELGNAPPDVIVWLWRHAGTGEPLLRNPQLLLRAVGEDARGPYIQARKELRKLLLDDPEFQAFLLDNGNPEAVSALVRNVLHIPSLDAGERQSLLVKIVRQFPEARKLVEQKTPLRGAAAEASEGERLLTSLRSYELRRRDLDEIINVKIPANSRAIAHARGYGDLRENAEYKAAKEMQRVLGRRRMELERALNEVVPTDFSTVRITDTVRPGCVVVLEREGAPEPETITLLGLWDSDPAAGILSYKTDLGRTLLGKRAGDDVELPGGRRGRIREVRPLPESLRPWLRGEDLPPAKSDGDPA